MRSQHLTNISNALNSSIDVNRERKSRKFNVQEIHLGERLSRLARFSRLLGVLTLSDSIRLGFLQT